MNLWDILILAAVCAALIGAVCAIRKGKTGSCSGECSRCGQSCRKRSEN